MGCKPGNIKYNTEADHGKQQAGASKTKERQRHTSEWKYARHGSDIDDEVGSDEAEHTRDDEPPGRIDCRIHHFDDTSQQCGKYHEDDNKSEKSKCLP